MKSFLKPRPLGVFVLCVCFLQLAMPEIVSACPTCKDGLHDDGSAAAYACSILFMMGMPFVILTFWVTTIVRLRANVVSPVLADSSR
ncbi:MAG: hypothetical protein ACI87E_001741 [Mariniblastus sp.]|jgi:hypothetical protein